MAPRPRNSEGFTSLGTKLQRDHPGTFNPNWPPLYRLPGDRVCPCFVCTVYSRAPGMPRTEYSGPGLPKPGDTRVLRKPWSTRPVSGIHGTRRYLGPFHPRRQGEICTSIDKSMGVSVSVPVVSISLSVSINLCLSLSVFTHVAISVCCLTACLSDDRSVGMYVQLMDPSLWKVQEGSTT